jgi:hypothetical protein
VCWERGSRIESYCLTGLEFRFCKMKRVVEWMVMWLPNNVNELDVAELYIEKWLKW